MNPVFELNDLHVSLQSHHKEIELVRGGCPSQLLPASVSAFWEKAAPASQCR